MPRPELPPPGAIAHSGPWRRGPYESIQVNVDEFGNNILGDAANEPSIAIDPTDPNKIVIGWRQFDTVASNFRQAGYGYSHDGGQSWTFPGVLEPGIFRSDPVLGADADGNVHFYSLTTQGGFLFSCDLFTTNDAGITWNKKVFGFGGDKAWMAIDRTEGPGRNNIYAHWSGMNSCCSGSFTRSVDGGQSFVDLMYLPAVHMWGTLSVGADGELFATGLTFAVSRSLNAQEPGQTPEFEWVGTADLGGTLSTSPSPRPNPGGLLGQTWIATDHSTGQDRGNVYIFASVEPPDGDPLDVMFARSTDGGVTWSDPIRVNDDPDDSGAWQWFGTLSVAPHGRIDAVWNDTRNTGKVNLSELYYSFSPDGGLTWSQNVPVSPVFNSYLGWPNQSKIGDYYDMISDDRGPSIAYAATFNGEQDVYFLRIEVDCDSNGLADADEIIEGSVEDCNDNFIPDHCESDADGDGTINQCDDDDDNDGIPDEMDACPLAPIVGPRRDDGSPISDTNGNCGVDLTDYARLRTCLNNSGPGVGAPLESCLSVFDYDNDGDVDVFDAGGFINAFTGDP